MEYILAIFHKFKDSMLAAYSPSTILIYVPLLVFITLLLEHLCVGSKRSTLFKLRQISQLDLLLFGLQQLNLSLYLGYLFTGGLAYFVMHFLYQISGSMLADEFKPQSVLVYLIAVDFLGYWYHRFSHQFKPLWKLHEIHHSAPSFNIIAAFRTHPLESVLSSIFVVIPTVAVFNPDYTSVVPYFFFIMMLYTASVKVLNMLHHSQIISNFGLFGKVLVSPLHHRIHHSMSSEHIDKNFGNTLIIWDKLFGTFCDLPEKEGSKIEIGVRGYDLSRSAPKSLWRSYLLFLSEALKSLRSLKISSKK
jgi:sterol desaturase/sphingolipid hydroxylase (fatty acid hydroxylase superfamily)